MGEARFKAKKRGGDKMKMKKPNKSSSSKSTKKSGHKY